MVTVRSSVLKKLIDRYIEDVFPRRTATPQAQRTRGRPKRTM